jgi:hypothetical protein
MEQSKLIVCESNRCGHRGTDSQGRTGCLLLEKPCRIEDHIRIGGGCVDPDRPLFEPHPRFIAKGHPVPQTKDPSDPTTQSSLTPSEIAATAKPISILYPVHYGGRFGMTGAGDPDIDGLQLIGQAFAAMSPAGRTAAMAWLKSMYAEN